MELEPLPETREDLDALNCERLGDLRSRVAALENTVYDLKRMFYSQQQQLEEMKTLLKGILRKIPSGDIGKHAYYTFNKVQP